MLQFHATKREKVSFLYCKTTYNQITRFLQSITESCNGATSLVNQLQGTCNPLQREIFCLKISVN